MASHSAELLRAACASYAQEHHCDRSHDRPSQLGHLHCQHESSDTATHLPKLLAAVKWSKVRIAMGAPRALLTAAWRKACGGHNLEAIRAVTEMVNSIILEIMQAMALREFQQWAEETGWSFWAQIMTPEEARGYCSTAPHWRWR